MSILLFGALASTATMLLLLKALHTYLARTSSSSTPTPKPSCPALSCTAMAPYPADPIRGRERYRVMMDVRRLDTRNWLTIDKNYISEHAVRRALLQREKSKVLQCLPESRAACGEALEEVVAFLCARFPGMFECERTGEKGMTVRNKAVGETFVVGGEDEKGDGDGSEALEVAARLAMEDLSVLMKNADGEYYLYVSPFGFCVRVCVR